MLNTMFHAMSIREPWCHAILRLGKDIENRTWSTQYRGWVLIHVPPKIDFAGARKLKLSDHQWTTGCLWGGVRIVDCVSHHGSEWFEGPWGIVLADPRPFDMPVAWGGNKGIFLGKATEPVIDRCRRAGVPLEPFRAP